MIKVNRTRRPAAIKENAIPWKNDYLLAVASQDKGRIKTTESRYKNKAIKNELQKMFSKKCAFCESLIEHISYSHIEHFKPKSKYRGKAFQWSNLLLACGVCNGKAYKGDNFPLKNEGGPIINPTLENPSDHLSFTYDEAASAAMIKSKSKRGETTLTLLGLNRTDLIISRSQIIKKIYALHLIYKNQKTPQEIKSEILEILNEAATATQQYSAFAKALLP
ncbi:TIGR02646 family protein [Pseudomonas aeruginosa]|nr:TIGR02646 family protein [Pseudomonas aeruginosa]MBX5790652.1 TIGR02646 family protein [Pseudomonas aeruginosa]MCT5138182.1 TIGR02646 family protein [Pseudomonas aeruginosa]MDP5669947.1 TIGR02646 family protein [Pseudomonas aeruginosa]